MSNFVVSSNPRIQPTLEEVPQQTVLLINYFPAEAACSFSLLVQRKQNQKKAHPAIWSLRDYPALLAFIGAKINSLRSNKFSLNPMKAAMLGCIEGIIVKTPAPKPVH